LRLVAALPMPALPALRIGGIFLLLLLGSRGGVLLFDDVTALAIALLSSGDVLARRRAGRGGSGGVRHGARHEGDGDSLRRRGRGGSASGASGGSGRGSRGSGRGRGRGRGSTRCLAGVPCAPSRRHRGDVRHHRRRQRAGRSSSRLSRYAGGEGGAERRRDEAAGGWRCVSSARRRRHLPGGTIAVARPRSRKSRKSRKGNEPAGKPGCPRGIDTPGQGAGARRSPLTEPFRLCEDHSCCSFPWAGLRQAASQLKKWRRLAN
jgi:hypothetical protein